MYVAAKASRAGSTVHSDCQNVVHSAQLSLRAQLRAAALYSAVAKDQGNFVEPSEWSKMSAMGRVSLVLPLLHLRA